MRRLFLLVLMLVSLSGLSWTQINYNQNQPGWYLNASLGLTLNPFRGGLDTILYHRTPLLDKPGILWKTTKLDWGLRNQISPATEYIGAFFRIEPLALFELTAEVGYLHMFKLLGYGLLTFDDILADYSSDTRSAITSTNGYNHGALMTSLVPSFRVAIGPVALVHNITWQYMDYFTNRIVYDYANVILRQGADSYIAHDTLLLLTSGDFRFGLAHYWAYVYGTGLSLQRAMAMAAWTPQVAKYNPYFILQVGMNIQDPYYDGQLYLALKVGVNLELFERTLAQP